jgi:hypothetical protein
MIQRPAAAGFFTQWVLDWRYAICICPLRRTHASAASSTLHLGRFVVLGLHTPAFDCIQACARFIPGSWAIWHLFDSVAPPCKSIDAFSADSGLCTLLPVDAFSVTGGSAAPMQLCRCRSVQSVLLATCRKVPKEVLLMDLASGCTRPL